MKKEDIEIGKRYWYRFCHDFQARSGICVGVTDEKSLFQNHDDAWVVALNDVHCEDVTIQKNQATKRWWQF